MVVLRTTAQVSCNYSFLDSSNMYTSSIQLLLCVCGWVGGWVGGGAPSNLILHKQGVFILDLLVMNKG